MDKGRYAADNVVDYLQNKDTKALVFTDKHLLYLNLKRQRLRWAFPVADLSTVTTHGQLPAPLPVHTLLAVTVKYMPFPCSECMATTTCSC